MNEEWKAQATQHKLIKQSASCVNSVDQQGFLYICVRWTRRPRSKEGRMKNKLAIAAAMLDRELN
jgi:hypothetical protein